MTASVPNYPTVGLIAKRAGVALHQVEYVIRTRGVKPVGRAGNALVYLESDEQYIRAELRRIDEDRLGVTP